jgi:DNA-binding FadR family transcriptional regulator
MDASQSFRPPLSPAPSHREAGSRVTGSRESGRSKLHVAVAEAFEAEILAGRLKIGERLPAEAEIARDCGVSVRAVREALQVLETKGLIERRHGERAIVVRNDVGQFLGSLLRNIEQLLSRDPQYLLQMMEVRQMIEAEVAGRLAQGGGAVEPGVEQALAGMRQAVEEEDSDAFEKYDAEFHLGLVQSVKNDVLDILYGELFTLIGQVIRLASRVPRKPLASAYDEHARIYQLIRSGNALAARKAIRRQLDGSAGYLKIVFDAVRAAK